MRQKTEKYKKYCIKKNEKYNKGWKDLMLWRTEKVKRLLYMITACVLAASLSACGGSREGMVQTPANMKMQRGRNYKEVIEDFEDKGFTNIQTETIEDLEYGHTFRNGHVEQISVGGDTNYDAGVSVPRDTKVIIRYHTYNPATLKQDVENEDSSGSSQQKESDSSQQKESDTSQQKESDSSQQKESDSSSGEAPDQASGDQTSEKSGE